MSAADKKKDASALPPRSSREDGGAGEPIIGLKVFIVINFGRCMEAIDIRGDERERNRWVRVNSMNNMRKVFCII